MTNVACIDAFECGRGLHMDIETNTNKYLVDKSEILKTLGLDLVVLNKLIK